MRFRAELREGGGPGGGLRLLNNLLQLVHKVKGNTVLKLEPRVFRMTTTTGVTDGSQMRCTLKASAVFDNIRIESRMDNCIWLLVDVGMLIRALRAGERSRTVTVKLARANHTPCLQVCAAVPAMQCAATHDVVHNVGVKVLTEEDVAELPTLPDFNQGTPLQVYLPPLADIAPFVDRVGKVCDRVTLSAEKPAGSTTGTLTLSMSRPEFNASSRFGDVQALLTDGGSQQSDAAEATCTVDLRKFHTFLLADALQPSETLCYFTSDRAVVLQAQRASADELNVVYIVPTLA